MELKQNPFSFYDFLGYLTPGSIFLYGGLAGYAHAYTDKSPYDFIINNLSFDKAEIYIPFVFAAYIVGHILSFLSSVLIERYSIWSDGYPSKYLLGMSPKGYFGVENHRKIRILVRALIGILLLPISLTDLLIGHWANVKVLYVKSLDKLLISIIWKKLFALIIERGGLNSPPEDTTASNADFFRYAYHYVLEYAPNHVPKMQNYVALYGFLRTLTLLSVVSFWWGVWHVFVMKILVSQAIPWLIISSLVTYIFYMSFIKFYRRFSLEVLMALAATYVLSDKIIPLLDEIDRKINEREKNKNQEVNGADSIDSI